MVNDNNYYQVSGWMINRLNLKGNELQAYAIIYGFTQDGQNWYTGSLAYLSDWLNSTPKTAVTVLASLVDKGLLIKESWVENGVKRTKYRADLSKLDFNNLPKKPQKQAELLYQPTKKPVPKTKPEETQKAALDAFDEYAGDRPELLAKLREFEQNRIALKSRMTAAAKKLLVGKLTNDFNNDNDRIRAIDEAILNGWKSVYADSLKSRNAKNQPKTYDYSNTGLIEGVDYL